MSSDSNIVHLTTVIDQLRMKMPYVIIALLAAVGTSLVMAQGDTCHGRSGYYVLKTDHLFFAYCDMELDCGGTKGDWMKIADTDTTKTVTCPSGWTNYTSYRTGGSAAGCYSAHFVTDSVSYSKVCGQVVGYLKGSTDAFYPSA